jgi:hypothetical protein
MPELNPRPADMLSQCIASTVSIRLPAGTCLCPNAHKSSHMWINAQTAVLSRCILSKSRSVDKSLSTPGTRSDTSFLCCLFLAPKQTVNKKEKTQC